MKKVNTKVGEATESERGFYDFYDLSETDVCRCSIELLWNNSKNLDLQLYTSRVFFCKIYEIFQSTFLYQHLTSASSET